ncbi:MAG TPA: acyltransferase [Anaerolineales bacterium]|nr:acyltransferase [Anaerolineales bacterium]
MLFILRTIWTLYTFAARILRQLLVWVQRPQFASHGSKFSFDPWGFYTFGTISVGDDVDLGHRPVLMAARSEIRIGNKVIFGPNVTIIGGRHNTSVVGQFMRDVTQKRPTDDLGVTIENDVWVASRAIILRGVTVGRGAVIGAGAVVTRNVPPYALVAGVPARVVNFRWDVDTILEHERALYAPDKRLSRESLLQIQTSSR